MNKACENSTDWACLENEIRRRLESEDWIEEKVYHGLKMWHVMFLSAAGVISFVILLCCCIKFRIPRTKQEIEGDFIRRKILRKFRRRLKAIQNQELDDMDLKRALDKIRAEFKSDTESIAASETGFSVATISSVGVIGGHQGHTSSTYRRASQIQIDISLEDLRAQSLGLRARLMLALSRLFGRPKVASNDKKPPTLAELESGGGGDLKFQISKPIVIGDTPVIPTTSTEVKVIEDKKSKKEKKEKNKKKEEEPVPEKETVEKIDKEKVIDKKELEKQKKCELEKQKLEKKEELEKQKLAKKLEQEKLKLEKIEEKEKTKQEKIGEKEKAKLAEKEDKEKQKLAQKEEKEKKEREKKEKAEREKAEKERQKLEKANSKKKEKKSGNEDTPGTVLEVPENLPSTSASAKKEDDKSKK